MSFDSHHGLMSNGHAVASSKSRKTVEDSNAELKCAVARDNSRFHGDELLADKRTKVTGLFKDVRDVLTWKNASDIGQLAWKGVTGQGLDLVAGSQVIGSLTEDSGVRSKFIESQVMDKYNKMLHPPLTYLGDAFQYRAADGKFNSVLHPHLGQAGAPYAKTVPSKTHLLGAQPDPGDIFDRLMARNEERPSDSGLSSMLIYHATIIIHDIFRTNDKDKNISDSSSYLDLSPLYGYTEEMQRKVRDDKYKLGLLKPDTFAEDRLLRQPPGVCIMLVMYNRYHNYAATQLRRINENGRFSVPAKYTSAKLVAIADQFVPAFKTDASLRRYLDEYQAAWKQSKLDGKDVAPTYAEAKLQERIDKVVTDPAQREAIGKFKQGYDAAWNKLDDDLFNTARLITCGMYVNISIHDYLRALMGFHQYNTTFTLDPRIAINEHNKKDAVSRGIGNQVTVEFNLLYRFHCAISAKDEKYTEDFMKESIAKALGQEDNWDPKDLSLTQFINLMKYTPKDNKEPWEVEFGLKDQAELKFSRNPITGLFDDQQLVNQLVASMDDPISNFGPCNVPRCLKSVEIMGIIQARKWEVGTLNDFRDFFGMERHKTFESMTKNKEVQDALRDLYDHPDKVELYPGIFCESDEKMGLDPGPSEGNSALWAAIFSDAITLVRSDRFYTVDWNTNSLTSWGMKEVTPDSDILKGSVFHRVIQRAFPGWFDYDSVRFFHPFYTSQQNAKYAREQGYDRDFKMKSEVVKWNLMNQPVEYKYDVTASMPKKPPKPVYLSDYAEVKAILSEESGAVINPACLGTAWLPDKVAEILNPGTSRPKSAEHLAIPLEDKRMVLDYFASVTREIVQREAITVDKKRPVYQIDVTRDLAIPVITRYVADFLGFGDRVRSEANKNAEFSENEIYEHITNCQVFLAYNVDETKMLKRRVAFQKSMKFLFDLAESGTIKEANKFSISRWVSSLGGGNNESPSKQMKNVGIIVAQRVLEREKDAGRAAAVLLLTALYGAYNSVLAFSSVLNYFIDGLADYTKVTDLKETRSKICDWLEIQALAMQDDDASDEKIKTHVLEAQRLSVKLPVVRKVAKSFELKDASGQKRAYNEGQTIVCDIYRASRDKANFKNPQDYLTYGSSLSAGFVHFNARETAVLGLTSMIKVLAQMKNLRRGHDSQGRLKKINVDQTYEGYANFMAPMRMQQIRRDVQAKAQEGKKEGRHVFDARILKPRTETYLTPEWDEMIPFPTTWKIRFDGYGTSDYTPNILQKDPLPDDFPPFYQPQGTSHFGGSFADVACACSELGRECKCTEGTGESGGQRSGPAGAVDVSMKGCEAPGSHL